MTRRPPSPPSFPTPPLSRSKSPGKKGWHKGPKTGGLAGRARHTEGHAEITHGETEREATQAPKSPEPVGPEEAARRSLMKDLSHTARHHEGQEPGRNDPAEETTD